MITKLFRTYSVNYLRQEKRFRDHAPDVVTIQHSCDPSGCRGIARKTAHPWEPFGYQAGGS
jgi:hypothetical protein